MPTKAKTQMPPAPTRRGTVGLTMVAIDTPQAKRTSRSDWRRPDRTRTRTAKTGRSEALGCGLAGGVGIEGIGLVALVWFGFIGTTF